MPWELIVAAASVLIGGVSGLAGILIALDSRKTAKGANTIAAEAGTSSNQAVEKAETANRVASEANDLSGEANATAKDSVFAAQRSADASDRSATAAEESAQWARESTKLKKQAIQLQASQHYWDGSANLSIRPGPKDSTGRMSFLVDNHGKGQAFNLSATFRVKEATFGPFIHPSLEVGKTWSIEGLWGSLFGPTDSIPDEPEDQRQRIGTLAFLTLNHRDGNGSFRRWFTVIVGPGRRFVDMNVEIREQDVRNYMM